MSDSDPISARFLFDQAADAMLVADGSGRIRDANPAAERLFGSNPGLLCRHMIGDLFESEGGMAASAGQDVPCRLQIGGGGVIEGRLTCAVGADGLWRGIIRPFGAENGGPAGGTGRDMPDLHRAEQQLKTLMEGIPQLVWRAAGDGGWTWSGPQWAAYTGQTDAESRGDGWLAVIHPDDRTAAVNAWRMAPASGALAMEARILSRADGRYRWFQTRAAPVRNAQGRIVEWLGTSTDVDDLRRLQQRQQRLVAELQHRVRNVLTVVRSVFARTVDPDRPTEERSDHFRGRLDNLARTQVIMTQSASGLVDLETLIREELLSVGAGDGPVVTIGGPDVGLPPVVAETLGLAIHELMTNALKYGALKVRTGTIEIGWRVAPDQGGQTRLMLDWVERGVPAVPVGRIRPGFGSELITETLPCRLGAETTLDFGGGGVRCTIALPLQQNVDGLAAM